MAVSFHIDKSVRKNTKKNLSEIFDEDYAQRLEEELYNKTKKYVIENDTDPELYLASYKQFVRENQTNLTDTKSIKDNKLIQHVKKFKIDPFNLVYMKPYELQPKTWEREMNRSKLAIEKIKNAGVTDRYTCPKCGEKRFKEELKQTRSADEPANIFIKCLTSGCNYGKSF